MDKSRGRINRRWEVGNDAVPRQPALVSLSLAKMGPQKITDFLRKKRPLQDGPYSTTSSINWDSSFPL